MQSISRRAVSLVVAICLVVGGLGGVFPAWAEDPGTGPAAQPTALDSPVPGHVEGVGTHFVVTGSAYLDLTLDSNQPIDLRLDSVPETVMLSVAPTAGVAAADLTLSGFPADTVFHKYTDTFAQHEVLTTDSAGVLRFSLDLGQEHLLFIQPRPSTTFIDSTGGGCTTIGTWDPVTETCTLTQSVSGTIQIEGSGITLDGGGKLLSGPGKGFSIGVYVYGPVSGITVKNLMISDFSYGGFLNQATDTTVSSVTVSQTTGSGIYIREGSGNRAERSTVSLTTGSGITVVDSAGSPTSASATLLSNTLLGPGRTGIDIAGSSYAVVTDNTVSNCNVGLSIASIGSGPSASNNLVYNNNFVNNATQAAVIGSGTGNSFSQPLPIGGNYWDNWTGPDEGPVDGIVDLPYLVPSSDPALSVKDEYPWAQRDGWKLDSIPPTSQATLSGTMGSDEWYRSSVEITLTAEDNVGGSGVATVEYRLSSDDWQTYAGPVTVSDEGWATLEYRATDRRGNVEATNTRSFGIDLTAPTISGAATSSPNENGWYSGPVTVSFTCSDDRAGVEVCPRDATITANGAAQSIEGTALDYAGNAATAEVGGINLDSVPPTVGVDGVSDGGVYVLGAVPKATCTASDDLSGLAAPCSGNLSGGLPNGVGTYVYVASASDLAGNSATAKATYRVIYRWDGFLQPINDTAHQVSELTSVFKAGSTVPAKLQLKRADGTVVQANSLPRWLTPAQGSPTSVTADETLNYTDPETTGGSYRWSSTGQQYLYNWRSDKSQAGYLWRIGVELDDGQVYYVSIGLR